MDKLVAKNNQGQQNNNNDRAIERARSVDRETHPREDLVLFLVK